MADFAGYEEWSLQAIVRGSVNGYTNFTSMDSQQTFSLSKLAMPQNDQDFLFAFSDFIDETSKVLDDGLEALYKPFYPVSDSISYQSILSPTNSTSKEVKDEAEEVREKQQTEEVEEKQTCLDHSNTTIATAYVPKYKKRKNQHKRVVMQVTAEALASDMWAWRKYGQKPIKGSPYPRSYYRCSSMKGCLARKQVEQSCSDPSMFIVTYTAEHCHSQPTRRNSLAGTVRNKFPTPKSPTNDYTNMEKIKDSITSSPSSSEVISPKSFLMASTEEELSETKVKPENIDEDEEQTVQWGCNNEFSILDMLMDDDFFAGLENLDGSIS